MQSIALKRSLQVVPRYSEPAVASDGACGEGRTLFGTEREAELGGGNPQLSQQKQVVIFVGCCHS